MLKYVFVFALGAGAGVWWGAYHQQQATQIAGNEDQIYNSAKAAILKQLDAAHAQSEASAPAQQQPTNKTYLQNLYEREKQAVLNAAPPSGSP